MTTQSNGLVSLVETDLPAGYNSEHDHGSHPPTQSVPHYSSADPDQIRQRLGYFREPSYLPSGFLLATSGIIADKQALILYRRNDGTVIETLQDQESVTFPVKQGYARSVTISGHPGYVIQGDWVEVRNSSGEVVRPLFWDPNEGFTVIFDTGTSWARMQISQGNNELDEAEVLKVAASM